MAKRFCTYVLVGLLVFVMVSAGFVTSGIALASGGPTPQPTPNSRPTPQPRRAAGIQASDGDRQYSSYADIDFPSQGQTRITYASFSSSSSPSIYSLQIWSRLSGNGWQDEAWNSCYCSSLTAAGSKTVADSVAYPFDVDGTHLFDYGGGNWVWRYSSYHHP